jgi:TolB-like protein
MADEQKPKQRLEIGHVLFVDIVGYSKLLTDEQSEALQELNQIVRNTEAAREAEAERGLTVLPTGDGMALIFTGSIEAPVECALEISHALRAQPSLPVRMGIHSGPVHHVKDANGRENIAGVGINIAQRVMDCGDAGHILVSKRVADDLAQQRRWQPYLHELGDVEVKHGVVVSLVNFYAETIGNPTPPGRIGKVRGGVRAFSKGTRKGLSPVARAIFIIVGLLIALIFGLAVVSVIFAPAIMRSLRKNQVTSAPQIPAVPSPPASFGDIIKNEVAKKITDELHNAFSQKEKAENEKKAAREASTIGSAIPEKSIAVLPFENLSDDKSAAYFADGIQDEILTKLAGIADLKVISRTSTAKYKSKPEDLKTVSQQLGVANLVEGTVQRAADKVRVNVQLIDARADAHLWAKSYDRNIKDVFAVESEVSQEIADALQAKLSPKEANHLATAPTQNSEAYDLFLKAEYEHHAAESSLIGLGFNRAAALYEQAISRDPNFALAIAGWVESRSKRMHWGDSLSEAEVEKVRKAADRVVKLAPDLAEAHIALGLFYYYAVFQYDRALSEFQRALALQPNNVEALGNVASIHLRQGQWESGLAESKKCEELDPRNASTSVRVAGCYLCLRMWDEAKRAGLHTLALDPHSVAGMHIVFFSDLCGTGDIAEATRILRTFPRESESTGYSPGGFISVVGLNAYLSIVNRDFGAALKIWEQDRSGPPIHRMRLVARAVIHVLAGDPGEPAEIDEARRLLEAKIREQPDDVDSILYLAWINLALKRKAETLKLAEQAVARVPMETDAIAGSYVLATVAELQAQSGNAVEAINALERLLSMPAGNNASLQRLKIDPVWDPIRNDPGFQQLLAGKELVGP